MENLWKKPENLDKSSQFIDNSSKNELFSSKIYWIAKEYCSHHILQ